jgi:hypothetical protein
MLQLPKDRFLFLLVLSDFVLAMMTIAAEFALHSTLPGPLREAAGNIVWPLFPWWVLMVVLTVASWIGLISFWRYARALYLTAWAIWLFLIAASGPSVMTSMGAVLTTMEALVGGAILALVYFTELGNRYEQEEPAQHSAPSTQH